MKSTVFASTALALLGGAGLYASGVQAQTILGTPGSPEARVVIDGKQLPAPPVAFGGKIGLDAQQSKPFWQPRASPPKGAPNVLLIMTDDAGFGVSSTFGGVIPTPNLDRVANAGLRYNQFHSTALCSPTRAALITGRNHHSVGNGVVSEQATGFPGYDASIPLNSASIGRILSDHGYATSWFGKDHNIPTYQYGAAGPFDQWPRGMGFDYFYGFPGGETDQYTPYLYRNTSPVYPWRDKPDYNLTHDLADDAIDYLRQITASAPDKPFFLMFVPGATHAPHQPPAEWIEKFKGKFDKGWNAMRDEIFANQKRLGVIPANAKLTDWPDMLPKWETLTPDQQKLYARQAEVFAAFVAYADYEIGRVIDQVEAQGDLDNTLIIYIEGDNGTSSEGSMNGTPFDLVPLQGIEIPVEKQLEFMPIWGSDKTQPHMAVPWAWSFDSPFKWMKQVASYWGGTRQGMAMSWPGHIQAGGDVRSQFHHVIDVVPTILEAAQIKAPDVVDGIKQKPIEGVSMAYTWTAAAAKAPSRHTTQYFEIFGNRAIYKDGWVALTPPPQPPWLMGQAKMPPVLEYQWELYNVADDFSQADNLATQRPDKLKELQAAFLAEAKKYNVLPLDNSVLPRVLAPKPSNVAGMTTFSYGGPVTGIPMSSAPEVLNRSFTITADFTAPEGGANGMLTTIGGRFGGIGLYMQNGKPIFDYNLLRVANFEWTGPDALATGPHKVVFDFVYDGPGPGKGGTGTLSVDGNVVDKKPIPHTIPFLMNLGESLDVGSDTRSGVNDSYALPFTFNGKINNVTYKVGPSQLLSDAEKAAMAKAMAEHQ